MDSLNEHAVRERLGYISTNPLQFEMYVVGAAHQALALLDAKDKEIARLGLQLATAQNQRDAANSRRDEALAKVAEMQAAMVDAYDLLHEHKPSMAAAKLFPHLPKPPVEPEPDPLVAVFSDMRKAGADDAERYATAFRVALARRNGKVVRGRGGMKRRDDVEQIAWVIERDDLATIESGNRVALHYYAEHRPGHHWWTPDHMKAKRFPDKVAALRETNGDPLLRVAEHMWMKW